MQKKKLLYIVTQGHWGGAQKYIYDLANTLANSFEVAVAVGEPDHNPDLQRQLKEKGIEQYQLKHLKRNISPLHDILAIFELRKLYKKFKPNIIHLNSSKASILGSLATYHLSLKTYKLPPTTYNLIYTVHGWVFNEPMSTFKKKLYKFLEKWTAKRKNKIIVLSQQEKNIAVQELNIPEEKIKIIPVGIDEAKKSLSKTEAIQKINEFLPNISEKELNESYLIGTIANFYPTKNLDNLIKAIAKINPHTKDFGVGVKDKLNQIQLILIGDGPEKNNLKSAIKNLQLKNVHLPGFLKNAEQYLPAFDIFVLPSKKEGLPYTILEAKINYVPIIATDVGAISTIVANKKTGLLVPPENVDKLAEAILYAYQNKEEMKQMAELGNRKDFQPYLKQNMIDQTKSLLQELLP